MMNSHEDITSNSRDRSPKNVKTLDVDSRGRTSFHKSVSSGRKSQRPSRSGQRPQYHIEPSAKNAAQMIINRVASQNP